jgi:sulfonate transport system substrate-binding protein
MFTALQQSAWFSSLRRFVQVRQLALFVLGLGLSLITASCSPPAPTTTAASPAASPVQATEIRIGYQKAATILNVLRTRKDLAKTLADSGATVTWSEFPAGPPMLEALSAGSIDFGYTGEAPPIFAQAAGTPLLYVAYDPWSPKAEAIVVPKDSSIKSVADLKGKKVAFAKGSNTNFLVVAALEKSYPSRR